MESPNVGGHGSSEGEVKSSGTARPALRVMLIGEGREWYREVTDAFPEVCFFTLDVAKWNPLSADLRDWPLETVKECDVAVVYASSRSSILLPSLFVGMARGVGVKVVTVFATPLNRYINDVEAFADHCLELPDDLKAFLAGYLEREGVVPGGVREAGLDSDNIPAPTLPDFAGDGSKGADPVGTISAPYSQTHFIATALPGISEHILDGAYPSFGEDGPSHAGSRQPIGVMPRTIWQEHRATELARAIHEHISGGFTGGANRDSLLSWVSELQALIPEIGRPAHPTPEEAASAE